MNRMIAGLAAALAVSTVLLAGAMPSAAAATGTTLYAYSGATGTTTGCAETTTAADQCSLEAALEQAVGGDTVLLATAGTSHYVGNWTASSPDTSAAAPLTIAAAPNLASPPVLDGNNASTTGCSHGDCASSILSVGADETVSVTGVVFENGAADDPDDSIGGAILNAGALTVTASTFADNYSESGGGAIWNGSVSGPPASLTVIGSTFVSNSPDDAGGAIANGMYDYHGDLTVIASSFSRNEGDGAGGAIANGSYGGIGTATVTDSSFTSNSTFGEGGAIDNGDNGDGMLTVSNSTFINNSASGDGGAIDNGDNGQGQLAVLGSTFDRDVTTDPDNGIADGQGDEILSGSESDATPVTTAIIAGDLFNGSCLQAGGTWTDDGRNAGVDTSCQKSGTGDVVGAAVGTELKVPAYNNGASTKTEALTAGNSGIGIVPNGATAVDAAGKPVALCPRTDQAGDKTPSGQACDAGAVDLVAPTKPTLGVSGGHKTVAKGASVTLTGKARPDSAVSLYRGSAKLASTAASAAGSYSFVRKVTGSATFTALGDHQVSSSLMVTVVTLSLKVSGHKPYAKGKHTLSGKAPAGFTVSLLRDGTTVAHVKAGAKNGYSFIRSLSGTHHYRISCDGVTSTPIKIAVKA